MGTTARERNRGGIPARARSAILPTGRRRAGVATALLAAALGAGGMVPADVGAQEATPDRIEKANITTEGAQSVGPAGIQPQWPEGSISADGSVVAFWSFAPDLVPGDVCCTTDVFVRDFDTGVTERVPGTQGVTDHFAVSPDGRYVAYGTWVGALVGGPPDDRRPWVAVYDRRTGQTRPAVELSDELSAVSAPLYLDSGYLSTVQQASDGSAPYQTTGHRPCDVARLRRVSLSDDGRWCATVIGDPNALPPADESGLVLQATTGPERTAILDDELTVDGEVPNGQLWPVAQSSTGRFLAFSSSASNHVEGDTNGFDDVFVADRDPDGNGDLDEQATLPVERISRAADGGDAGGGSQSAAISADGRFVVFNSWAPDLVVGDGNDITDLFRHDRARGETERITVAVDGGDPSGTILNYAISADGTRVAFDSWANDLVPEDTSWFDVFRWAEGDRAGGSSTGSTDHASTG
jgi:hypothetical protein